jgi:hypothetical protein
MIDALLFGAPVALAAVVAYHSCAQPLSNSSKSDSLRNAVQAGLHASKDSEKIGRALLDKLGDQNLTDKELRTCVLALGKLRYQAAIPKLVELIHLDVADEEDPKATLGRTALLPSLLQDHPCMRALVEYGELALPDVAEAYLKTDSEERKKDLAYVLTARNSRAHKVYLQGLLLERQDSRSKIRLFHIIEQLQENDEEDTFP